jgi:UDP-N-acetylglucosamine--dolichyl-phosphate N-acetylglucosaminephosphotransferase
MLSPTVVLAISFLISLISTFVLVPWLIKNLRKSRMVGIDLNKWKKPRVPEMGGLAVIIGFYLGAVFLFLFIDIDAHVYYISLLAIMGAAVVGIMDDLFELRQRVKAILPFIFALPLGIMIYQLATEGSAGDPQTFGTYILGIDLGILMAIAIPFGITCAANASNMLEGFNGLGAGLGIIMTVTMILVSIIDGMTQGLFLLVPLLGTLLAFLYFNRYPAKIFPGDTLTLFTGAIIACAAIVSYTKVAGAIIFIPLIVEFFLKLKGRFKAENYGVPDKNGYLTYNGKIESLSHVVMKWKRLKEWQLVAVLWAMEIVVCAIVVIGVVVF